MAHTWIPDENGTTVGRRGFREDRHAGGDRGAAYIPPDDRYDRGDGCRCSAEPIDEPGRAQGCRHPKLPAPEAGYECLGPDEASFVEAMVNVMCPADEL